MTALLEPPAFMKDASCRGGDDLFFPGRGRPDVARKAKLICSGCLVRAACLTYALDTDQEWGIWGGTSEGERRRIQRLRRGGHR